MPYFHVRIKYSEAGVGIPLRFFVENLSEREVRRNITEPYNDGVSFSINEEFFEGDYVDNVAVFKTDREFKDLIFEIRRKYDVNATPEEIWTYVMEGKMGEDVTDLFLAPRKDYEHKRALMKKTSRDVFIVHGKDYSAMKELKTILEEVGLNPIILHEQAGGSRTIAEKLEKYSDVGFAFVILTPDDLGSSFDEWRKAVGDIPHFSREDLSKITYNKTFIQRQMILAETLRRYHLFLKPRARQNVILEFGYFMGLLGRDRVCCLFKGDVELPSDMHGICYVPFENSINEIKGMILKELREAGYEIKV